MSLRDLTRLLCEPPDGAGLFGRRAGLGLAWAEFSAEAAAWSVAFARHPGQRFALYFDDSMRLAGALFGLWQAGKIAYLPGDALPETVRQLRLRVDGLAGDLSGADVFMVTSDAPDRDWQPLDPGAEQLVIFTSGSTAEPLAIPKRLGQLFKEVEALELAFGARLGAAEVLATVSHQHIYGLLFRVLWPLAAGRPIHGGRYAFVEDVAAALAEGSDAVLIASPAHLKRLPAQDLNALRCLRAVFSSGGPLPDEALMDCQRVFGQAPIEVYGSSETGGVAWRQRSCGAPPSWQPLPGIEWRVRDELLEIRSPHLPAASWLLTADRARAVAEGLGASFELLGRADRVLKIEEKRVSVAAIEEALLASRWLLELRVMSLAPTQPGGRQQLAVVAVPNEAGWALHEALGKQRFAERLRTRLLQCLEPVSAPRRWRFVAALPVNSQGKTTQAGLERLFDARRPSARLLHSTASLAELTLVAEAGMPQFDGHFDHHPIVPGVAQVDWAILFGRELFALPPQFRAIEGLKFQQVITPGQTLRLLLDFKAEQGQLNFKFSSARGVHASGRIIFGASA